MVPGAVPFDSHVRVSCGRVRALIRRCRVCQGWWRIRDELYVRTNEVAVCVVSVVPSSLGFISTWGVLLVYLWGQG